MKKSKFPVQEKMKKSSKSPVQGKTWKNQSPQYMEKTWKNQSLQYNKKHEKIKVSSTGKEQQKDSTQSQKLFQLLEVEISSFVFCVSDMSWKHHNTNGYIKTTWYKSYALTKNDEKTKYAQNFFGVSPLFFYNTCQPFWVLFVSFDNGPLNDQSSTMCFLRKVNELHTKY